MIEERRVVQPKDLGPRRLGVFRMKSAPRVKGERDTPKGAPEVLVQGPHRDDDARLGLRSRRLVETRERAPQSTKLDAFRHPLPEHDPSTDSERPSAFAQSLPPP